VLRTSYTNGTLPDYELMEDITSTLKEPI